MSVVINTNFAATIAASNLARSNDSLQKSLNRLSSGSKIVTPSDDAGGLAVSMKLNAAAKRQGADDGRPDRLAVAEQEEGDIETDAERQQEGGGIGTDRQRLARDRADAAPQGRREAPEHLGAERAHARDREPEQEAGGGDQQRGDQRACRFTHESNPFSR